MLISGIERGKAFLFENRVWNTCFCFCAWTLKPILRLWRLIFDRALLSKSTFNVPSRNLQRIQTDSYYTSKISPGNLSNVLLKAAPLGRMLDFHIAHSRIPESFNWKQPKASGGACTRTQTCIYTGTCIPSARTFTQTYSCTHVYSVHVHRHIHSLWRTQMWDLQLQR